VNWACVVYCRSAPIVKSVSMQQHVYEDCRPLPSTRTWSARECFRQIRREVTNSFRKTPKIDFEVVPSPFIEQPDQHSSSSTDSTPPKPTYYFPGSSVDTFSPPIMDGPNERLFGRNQRIQNPINVSAIFVHAGAGYHSTTNEHIHLGACNE
jgi:taspase (threonine aspartase 1)